MTFTVPEEIEALRKTLRQFASNEVIPLEREHNLSWDVPPPKDLRKQVRRCSKELGLYGADMPVEVGGGGIGFTLTLVHLLDFDQDVGERRVVEMIDGSLYFLTGDRPTIGDS